MTVTATLFGIAFLVIATVALARRASRKRASPPPTDLSALPEQFVVFDLETTGLSPTQNEIIEIGAIRVSRDSVHHQSFEALIRPKAKIPKKITKLTGITQRMVDRDGDSLEDALGAFLDFIGDLPLVSFNAPFDMGFLREAVSQCQPGRELHNPVSCALKMSRRAWPGRDSYRLSDLAQARGLSLDREHRALGDCRRTLTIYGAAAAILGSAE